MDEERVLQILRTFYSRFSPDYVESVPYLAEQYRGRYGELFALIRDKYAARNPPAGAVQPPAAAAAAAPAAAEPAPLPSAPGGDAAGGTCAVQ